jgi:hypothetical protein
MNQQFAAQQGGQVQGCPILRPANGPVAAIRSIVIPYYLKQLGGQYAVLSSQELPAMAAAFAPTYATEGQAPAQVRAGVVRIEYNQNGRAMDQDIYSVYLLIQGPGGYVWGLDHITAFKAEKGALDQATKTFALMAGSLQPTPKFMDAIGRVTSSLVQQFYQTQEATMQRVAAEVQAEQQVSQQIMSGWQARQKAETDAIANYDAGAIRGVTNEKDAYGNIVQVPDEAAHAWTDASGEVVYTESESFNPSQYKNVDWQQLK